MGNVVTKKKKINKCGYSKLKKCPVTNLHSKVTVIGDSLVPVILTCNQQVP